MAIYADLHTHTTQSDGQLTIEEIPNAAKDAGVNVVAITDHDRIHPELSSKIETRDGITLLRGIELRVSPGTLDERIDLLGYGVEPTDDLVAELDRLQEDRISRAASIIDSVNEQLGVDLDVQPSEGIGRPHIARAIDENPNTTHTYSSAFESVIGKDCPAYQSRNVTSFEDGVELLIEACDVVGLAHPYRYDNPEGALQLTEHLDAVEVHYPYETQPETADALRDVLDRFDLLPIGGSDAHELELGKAGLIEAHYDMLEQQLTG